MQDKEKSKLLIDVSEMKIRAQVAEVDAINREIKMLEDRRSAIVNEWTDGVIQRNELAKALEDDD